MKKITIITGDQGVGKTSLAKHLTKNKNSIWLSIDDCIINYEFCFRKVTKETEVIVIDNVTSKEIDFIKILVISDIIIIHKQCKKPFAIERPELIIISNDLNLDCSPNITHIKFT